jgi:hypothetical protein
LRTTRLSLTVMHRLYYWCWDFLHYCIQILVQRLCLVQHLTFSKLSPLPSSPLTYFILPALDFCGWFSSYQWWGKPNPELLSLANYTSNIPCSMLIY